MTAIILLGHGSRDPRADVATREIAAVLSLALPDVDVRVAYLDLTRPTLQEAVDALPHDAGRVVVLPLLLSRAFHARVDVPRAVEALDRDVVLAEPIGPELALALDSAARLPSGPLVLGTAGTSDMKAQQALRNLAQAMRAQLGYPVTVAYAAQAAPNVTDAITKVGAVGVVAFVLLPGVLPDRIAEAAAAAGIPVTPPLGATTAVIDVLCRRFATALAS
jgi:sirohydrochlorin ferrochelatase